MMHLKKEEESDLWVALFFFFYLGRKYGRLGNNVKAAGFLLSGV